MAAPKFEQDELDYVSRKPVKFHKWIPKKWRPEYERIVAMSAVGKSNKQIAAAVGFTPVHVSNILNLPQATELMERIVEKMRERALVDIPQTLNYVAEKGAARLKSMVDDDALFEKSPFAVIDRAMDVMKGLNHLKGGGNGAGTINVAGNMMVVPEHLANNMAEGLNKMNEVRRLHSGEDNNGNPR